MFFVARHFPEVDLHTYYKFSVCIKYTIKAIELSWIMLNIYVYSRVEYIKSTLFPTFKAITVILVLWPNNSFIFAMEWSLLTPFSREPHNTSTYIIKSKIFCNTQPVVMYKTGEKFRGVW